MRQMDDKSELLRDVMELKSNGFRIRVKHAQTTVELERTATA
jgi:hypothetical protein